MKDIAIYGAGGFGREVACMIEKINSLKEEWNLIGFFDDGEPIGKEISHFGKCLGGINELNSCTRPLNIVLCFGVSATIQAVKGKISNPNISFPNLIDPDFSIADKSTFSIGIGNIIKGHCTATCDVALGNFNVLNGFVNIGHDVSIGDFNVLMPGTRISGDVCIGNNNMLGSGCFIKQLLRIGDNVTISPMSVLLTKPKNGATYIGNPAKIFKF